MALADGHLLIKSSISAVDEGPQHVSPASETFLTDEKADPTISTNALTALEAATGSASSIVPNLSPEADTQPERLRMACIHLVNAVEPADNTLNSNISGYNFEIFQ
jgi:hypothetical protein